MVTSKQFEDFLKTVDLPGYRQQYSSIKTVEMDLPKNIQAIASLYDVYWANEELLFYDDFYAHYYTAHQALLKAFQEKVHLCAACFALGLPARIYRTWASLITQIHAGYVAQDVFGEGTVAMSPELDHSNIDFQVTYSGQILNFQVKKNTQSREVRASKTVKVPSVCIDLEYVVPNSEVFEDPRKRNGDFRKPYLDFMARTDLKRLPNGFIVFTPEAFLQYKTIADTEGLS